MQIAKLREQLERLDTGAGVSSDISVVSVDQFLTTANELKRLAAVIKDNKYAMKFYRLAISQMEDLVESLEMIKDEVQDSDIKTKVELYTNVIKKLKECI